MQTSQALARKPSPDRQSQQRPSRTTSAPPGGDHATPEDVLEATDMLELVGQYTELKASGSSGDQFIGLCPMPDHSERTPSFSVSGSKKLYYCFGCHAKGNAFSFYRAMTGASFAQALQHLAQKAGLRLGSRHTPKNQKLKNIMLLVAGFFKNSLLSLPQSHPARVFCKKRTLLPDTIKAFGIGYAPTGRELQEFLRKKSVSTELAHQLSLLRQNSSRVYPYFRNRLLFPIWSHGGTLVGFGGRSLDGKPPKYINSPEGPLFKKGHTLYGLHQSAKFIRQAGVSVIVEGYTDFLALWQAGITNAVATMGTALTAHHAQALARCAPNCVLLFDGDAAGVAAAEKCLPTLLKHGLSPRVLYLPDRLDPDSFLQQHGIQKLLHQLRHAPDMFEHQLAKAMLGFTGKGVEVRAIVDQFLPIVQQTHSPTLRSIYRKKLEYLAGVPLSDTASATPRVVHAAPQLQSQSQSQSQSKDTAPSTTLKSLCEYRIEMQLLKNALQELEVFKQAHHHGAGELFFKDSLKALWQEGAKRLQAPQKWLAWRANLDSSFISEKIFAAKPDPDLVMHCIERLKNMHSKQEIKQQILNLQKQKLLSQDTKETLMERQKRLQKLLESYKCT